MSYYYKYKFISPEGIFAIIGEEFKAYLDTGAIDNLLFPTYVNKCLNKLGRSSYVITEDLLIIEDFEARLPDNFYAVREAWLCTTLHSTAYQTANSFYSQTLSTTIQIAPVTIGGTPCNSECPDDDCEDCLPEVLQAIYKTNHQMVRSYRREYLLKPGNISAKKNCDVDYVNEWEVYTRHSNNPYSSNYDSFDIRDNKFVTNFREGAVHLVFYSTDYDETGNQLIPDNYRIKEYIEAFIKYKLFETLTNQTNDETFNQLQQKLVYYKQLSDEAFIMADIEVKKQTVYQKTNSIKRQLNRFKMYELPTGINTYYRRNT
jgi:hypothetical protein